MKKIYLALLTLVTVCAIIVGCVIHLGGFMFRGMFDGLSGLFGNSNVKTTSFSEDYSDITKVEIDADLMNIFIREEESFSVEFNGAEDLKPEVTEDKGTLKIKQKQKKSVKPSNWNNIKNELIITVPKGTTLEDLDIDLDLGNVEMDDILAKEVSIDADLGNVIGNDVTTRTLTIEADLGNVEMYKTDFKDLNVNADMGNVIVESINDLDDYTISAKADLGNVSVAGKDVDRNYSSKGGDGSISVKASMGNVEVYSTK